MSLTSLAGRRCREWAYYILGALACELVLLGLWLSQDAPDFIRLSRTVGIVGIAVTVIYKTTVIAVMLITRPKTPLDRRLIWHLGALDAFMLYAFIANVFPHWLGLPKSTPLNPPEHPDTRLIVAAVVWYNIIGYVTWSAIAVLNALYRERWRYVHIGMFRTLKLRTNGQPERVTDANTETGNIA